MVHNTLTNHAFAPTLPQDTATLLAAEERRLAEELEHQAAALQRLQLLVGEVTSAASMPPAMPLEQLRGSYAAMRTSYPEEYVLYNLPAAALAVALPRFQALMRGWAPLAEPARGAPEFGAWRPLLERPSARQAVLTGGEEDPFEILAVEVLLPPLRCVCAGWRECVGMCVCGRGGLPLLLLLPLPLGYPLL